MDPTRPDNNQVPQQPVISGSIAVTGTKEAPITINTTNPVPERPVGVEPSYPEIHETAEGFIHPNISAQAPIAEINAQLRELGTKPASLTSGLNTSQARADKLREGPAESGGTWVGFLITKFNKVAALFRPKQSMNQPI